MKKEFDGEKVVAALTELGYDHLSGIGGKFAEMLSDPAKCRELVGKVQGPEAVKRIDPVYMARYKKRAERMVQEYMNLQSKETPAPAGPKTEVAVVAPTEANQPETPPTAAPAQTTEGKKNMAKKAKVAKAKKAPKATKEKVNKGPGVIDTIVTVLQAGGGSVQAIAEKVVKKLPDREVEKVLATVKIQMTRLMKPKADGGRALKIKREKQEGTNELLYSL